MLRVSATVVLGWLLARATADWSLPSQLLWVMPLAVAAAAAVLWDAADPGGPRDPRTTLPAQQSASLPDPAGTVSPDRDALTLLGTRHRFDAALQAEWSRGAREEHPLSVLLLQVDGFEDYADLHGQAAANEMLRIIASCLYCGLSRCTDVTARYDDRQVVALLPNTDGFGALLVARRVRDDVLARRIPYDLMPSGIVSVCIGLATQVPWHEQRPASLVDGAAAALAVAQRLGASTIEVDGIVHAANIIAGRWNEHGAG